MYSDIVRRKKEQRKKWQAKYLEKLGVNADLEDTEGKDDNIYRSIMKRT